ncbi:hypothetical protein [Streptococcus suis]|uniref:hypothetical protein n=1 Tax=Streptococcus suis TaxID=1307 RepID=UPI001E580C48|nr:hypothetical protein [Streptococcus suis]
MNKNFVTFSKGIVQALEYPAHVLVAFNKDTKVMGIQVCRAKTRGAFSFSKPVGEQKGIVQVGHKNLKENISGNYLLDGNLPLRRLQQQKKMVLI